jgi:hypothetical protein
MWNNFNYHFFYKKFFINILNKKMNNKNSGGFIKTEGKTPQRINRIIAPKGIPGGIKPTPLPKVNIKPKPSNNTGNK